MQYSFCIIYFKLLFSSRDTYVERQPGDTIDTRNARAIRVATEWYNKHLVKSQPNISKKQRVQVILLTDDTDNLKKSNELGIAACTVSEYVKSLKDPGSLEDKLSQKNSEVEIDQKILFPPHLTPNQIHEGIKSGKLHQGSFIASRENYLEGTVSIEGMENMVKLLINILLFKILYIITFHRF